MTTFKKILRITLTVILVNIVLLVLWTGFILIRDYFERKSRNSGSITFLKEQSKVEIPMEVIQNRPLVKTRIGDNDYWLVVDTGATLTHLSDWVVSKEKSFLTYKHHANFSDIFKMKVKEEVYHLRKFNLSDLLLIDLNISKWVPAKTSIDVVKNGALGANVLSKAPFTLDFEASTLTFYNPKSFSPPSHISPQPLKWEDNSPFVQGMIDGKKEWFFMDTGFTGFCTMRNLPSISKNIFSGNLDRVVSGWFEEKNVKRGIFREFKIFGETYPFLPVYFPTVETDLTKNSVSFSDSLIGMQILKNFKLTFDYTHHQIWIEKNPERSIQEWRASNLLNTPNFEGNTPLMNAVKDRNLPRIATLIEAGSKTDIRDCEGYTPLLFAILDGFSDIAVNLIKAGADVNAKEKFSPLWAACHTEQIDLVQKLLEAGAKIDDVDEIQSTALMEAASRGNLQIVMLLLKHGASINLLDDAGYSALHLASEKGFEEIVQALIKGGAEINARESKGRTPLILASQFGHLKVVELLVSHGANLHLLSTKNMDAIEYASLKHHLEVVKKLISLGTPVDRKNNKGETLLMSAAFNGDQDIVEYLVLQGSDVNAKNNDLMTPAMYSAMGGHMETLKFLIEQGADPKTTSKNGSTLRDCALESKNIDTILYLKSL